MFPFLTPILALVVWTLVIWVVMYARLIPYLRAADVPPQETRSPVGEWRKDLPENVQSGLANYNHLFEQPTIFYALMVFLQISGGTELWISICAWLFVTLRIIHSLIQITSNQVIARFTVFFVSMIVLIIMALRGIALVF